MDKRTIEFDDLYGDESIPVWLSRIPDFEHVRSLEWHASDTQGGLLLFIPLSTEQIQSAQRRADPYASTQVSSWKVRKARKLMRNLRDRLYRMG